MSDQPTALRLAEKLGDYGGCTLAQMDAAAAELRRLHAENEALKAELMEQARVNGMGSERESRLMALNAELLEALKHAAECVQKNYLPDKCGHDWDEVIAKAEASNGS